MKKFRVKLERVSYVEIEADSMEDAYNKIYQQEVITDKMIEDCAEPWDICSIEEDNK